MASIIKRPGSGGKTVFRAEIRRKGFPKQIKTFQLKRDAVGWARKIEHEMDAGTWRDLQDASKYLFKDALDRYLSNVSIKKRPGSCKRDHLSASYPKFTSQPPSKYRNSLNLQSLVIFSPQILRLRI